jgi:hypothetical protein
MFIIWSSRARFSEEGNQDIHPLKSLFKILVVQALAHAVVQSNVKLIL